MSDLTELYQELVLDHNSKPRNFRKLASSNHSAEGYNPLCGDRVTIYLTLNGGVIEDVGFQGSGCAISRASTSMMTESVRGKRIEDAERLFRLFHDQVTGEEGTDPEALGDLEAFAGVKEYPSRVKCAILGWHTLKAALEGNEERISTEPKKS